MSRRRIALLNAWDEVKAGVLGALFCCLWAAFAVGPALLAGQALEAEPGTGAGPVLVLVFAFPALFATAWIADLAERLWRNRRSPSSEG